MMKVTLVATILNLTHADTGERKCRESAKIQIMEQKTIGMTIHRRTRTSRCAPGRIVG